MIEDIINIGGGVSIGSLGIGGGIGPDGLYLIKYGGIPWYVDYTRLDIAYAADPSGDPVEVAQDVPPYEYVDGKKVFRQCEGTNKCEADGIPDGSTAEFTTGNLDLSIEGDVYKAVSTANNAFVLIDGTVANTNKHSASMWGYSDNPTGVYLYLNAVLDGVEFSDTYSRYCLEDITPDNMGKRTAIWIPNAGTTVYFKLFQLTETTYCLPDTVSSKDGPVTVNKGTQSLLAADVDTASFLFDSAQSDNVEVPHSSALNYAEGDILEISAYINMDDYSTTPRQRLISKDKQYTLRISETGFLSFAVPSIAAAISDSTVLVDNETYLVGCTYNTITDELTYYVDGDPKDTVSFNTPPVSDTGMLFLGSSETGTTDLLDGSMWDVQIKINGVVVEQYKLSEYREDTFVRGEYGNHGTASRSVDNLIAENQGFGYPVNAKARLPWRSSIGTKYGLAGLFGGVDSNPAVGRVIIENYTTHDLSVDQPIIEFDTLDFVPLYVEATTGLIKGYDGTNTCVSPSALVAGTVLPKMWLAFNQTQMWISFVDSAGVITKGTVVTFAGAFPDIGTRLFGLTNGTYQTNENLYFDDELAYSLLVDGVDPIFDGPDQNVEYL